MKKKSILTKSIPLLLSIVALSTSVNIYSSYEDFYRKYTPMKDAMVYSLASTNPSMDWNPIFNHPIDNKMNHSENSRLDHPVRTEPSPIIHIAGKEISKDLLLPVSLLFLSFVGLSSMYNFIVDLEENRQYGSKRLKSPSKNENPTAKPHLPRLSNQGVK